MSTAVTTPSPPLASGLLCEHDRMSWTPRRIALASVANLRDVGGAPVTGGAAVRDGVLFRSTQLASVTAPDKQALEQLRLGLVVDLRTSYEVEQAPDVPVAKEYRWLDVLRDSAMASQASMGDLFSNPTMFAEILGDGTAVSLMKQAYLEIVDLPSAQQAYGRWLRDLAELQVPALVHCTNGKDRTGWAVALALLTVGASEDAVLTDYLTTNEQYLPALESVFDQVASKGLDPALLEPVLGVREEYLATALARVQDMGGLDAYLVTIGVEDTHRQALRDWLVI